MLSTILTGLQQLISPRFVVASFFPALVFWFSNALMLFFLNEPFRFFVGKTLSQSTLEESSVLIASSLIGVAISGYALSAVIPALQSLLEGGNWPESIAGFFAPSQARRLKELDDRIANYRRVRGGLEKVVKGDAQRLAWYNERVAWQDEISSARERGCTQFKTENDYTFDAPSAKAIEELAAKRDKNIAISADDIAVVVNKLELDLEANNAGLQGSGGEQPLETSRKRLLDLIDYAVRYAQEHSQREAWRDELCSARERGCAQFRTKNDYTLDAPSAKAIEELATKRNKGLAISVDDIALAVDKLKLDLEANNADLQGSGGDHPLETTRKRLLDLIDFAVQYTQERSQRVAWQNQISAARERGCTQCEGKNKYTLDAPSAKVVAQLAAKREKSLPISADDITAAVNKLNSDLATNDADYDKTGPRGDYALEKTRQLLWDLIDYAEQHAQDQHRRLINRRRFSFGTTTIAPTRMGNVAQTIQSYAVERYDFNFELFWSRMQRVLQKDANFSPILQAAKTQLDFLVGSCMLTGLWVICWAILLVMTRGPLAVFLAVALGGPLLSWVWYLTAVAHYRTFADVLRTSVDLFRFDLLNELHLPLPSGVLEEREMWNLADRLHALYELHDLRYVPPKSTS